MVMAHSKDSSHYRWEQDWLGHYDIMGFHRVKGLTGTERSNDDIYDDDRMRPVDPNSK
ncbi:hypothetical protein NC652_028984 [Populus alba x Populus x berolinensis]|nr:hypothetical protein NC652_028984 [Populus alba x Populus x berolinensis]